MHRAFLQRATTLIQRLPPFVWWCFPLVLSGTVLRIYRISTVSYWMDEAYSITIAEAIAQHGYPLLDSGRLVWRSPLYHYLLSAVLSLFDTSEITTRLLSILFGVGVIIVLTIIAKKWFGRVSSVIVCALASFSYWEIAWSRQARMYIVFQFFFWLTLLLFERFLYAEDHRRRYLIAACGAGLATILSHEFGWMVFLPCILLLILKEHRRFSPKLPLFVPYIATLFFSILLPFLYFKVVRHFPVPLSYGRHYFAFLFREYSDLLLIALAGLFLLLFKSKEKQQHVALVLFGLFVGGLTLFSSAFPLLQYRYLFFLFPALVLLAAVLLSRVWRIRRVGPLLVIIFFLMSKTIILIPQAEMPLESDPSSSPLSYKSFTPQPDFRSAYEFIRTKDPKVLITPYPVMTRLYLDRDDTFVLPFDVTGGLQSSSAVLDLYTGVPAITAEGFQSLREHGDHGFILIDDFSQRRIDTALRDIIDSQLQEVYYEVAGDWSSISIYAY